MDVLRIENTSSTPKVILDAEEKSVTIWGASRPENASSFYKPIKKWLEEYLAVQGKSYSSPLNVEVKIQYFNSPSLIEIIEVFRIIRRLIDQGQKVLVNWYYDEDDELIYDTAQEISDIIEVPFNFIED